MITEGRGRRFPKDYTTVIFLYHMPNIDYGVGIESDTMLKLLENPLKELENSLKYLTKKL